MEWYLPVIWAALIGTAVALYVILDGFDLGIGILFPYASSERERNQMMNSIAPFWHGNETWLVLGAAGMFVAFPKAYAVIMPAFYLPVIFMLLALVLRGVAFEFRVVSGNKGYWNAAFAGGATVAALCQGVSLAGLIEGVKVENGAFAGGSFDWATPFGLLCAIGVVTGYALLGSTWLILKTDGEVQARARQQARPLLLGMLALMALVSLWTPLAFDRIAARWFSLPNILFLWPVPVITAVIAYFDWLWIRDREVLPFLSSIALFLLGYLGLVISVFPYLVPPSLTIWQTAAVPASQIFMLLGTIGLLPLILCYTGFVYWLFRGKVREGEGYH